MEFRHSALALLLSLILTGAVNAAAEPPVIGMVEQVVLFDFQHAGTVARGTVKLIDDNDPIDGIGAYGGTMEVEFTPAVVFKGGMEPNQRYHVDIPNSYLSYQSTYMSRDSAYLQKQALIQQRLDLFSAEFGDVAEAHNRGEMSDAEFSSFSEIADIAAREITARKAPATVYSSSAKPVEEVPIQKIVFDGNMYTLFLMPPAAGGSGKFTLSTRDRSVFGGLENFYIQRLLENGSAGPSRQ